jgi:phosphatidylserine decarboxylase
LGIYISSIVLAFAIIGVQSIYWKFKYIVWIPCALVIGLATGAIVNIIDSRLPDLSWILLFLLEGIFVCALLAAAVLLWFFRDPQRVPQEKNAVVLSPADGKIIYVKKIEEESHLVSIKAGTRFPLDELMQAPWPFRGGYLIGIEMNVMDVHVNRAPIEGRIVLRKRVEGKFPGLGKPNAEIRSERFTTVIDNGNMQVGVVQIASRFVRRIVSYVKEDQHVQLAQRIGMIRFGSQVDVVIPDLEGCQITVEPGMIVRAGLTVISRYRQNSRS